MENKTPAETFLKFPSVLRAIDRSDRNPPITATSVTFTPSLRHAKRTVIGEFRSDLSITCMIDGNFGNVSAGILFSRIKENGGNGGRVWQYPLSKTSRSEEDRVYKWEDLPAFTKEFDWLLSNSSDDFFEWIKH